ncbi:hypothetical protein HanPSC8_Chr07g0293511 [Helianthus annuus]|nr:hypothetical protein HanPSC8_Chr07g0293511 [Helianthus annuus]
MQIRKLLQQQFMVLQRVLLQWMHIEQLRLLHHPLRQFRALNWLLILTSTTWV